MSRLSLVLAVLLAAAAALLWWNHSTLERMSQRAETLARSISEVKAENAGLSQALLDMDEARQRDTLIIETTLASVDSLTSNARALRSQLQEALAHAKTVEMDAPLPAAATDALCLRYLAARGQSPDRTQTDAARGAAARAAYPPANLCEAWRGVTLRHVVDWAGLLLDHAGAERLDKAGLREWVIQIERVAHE